MALFYFVYIFFLVIGSFISIYLIHRLLTVRRAPGAYYLIWTIGCVTFWSLVYILEISLPTFPIKYICSKLEYLGIPFIPISIFGFVLNYIGRGNWLTRFRLMLLVLIPAATSLMALTNDWHNLLWSSVSMPADSSYGPLLVGHGLWYNINVVYSYSLLILSTFFLAQIAVRTHSLYRHQASIMLAGMLIPWIGNSIYIFRLTPFPALDWTPLAFTLTVLILEVGFVRYGFMDILPIAQNLIFNAIEDGVIVADPKDRIVEINPAAERIFCSGDDLLIGKEVRQIFPDGIDLGHAAGMEHEITSEIELGTGSDQRNYNLRITSIKGQRGQRSGRMLTMTDITNQKKAEQQLRQAHQDALEANRMKTQLLASISHDLRTPLGAIMGYAEMIESGVLGPANEEQKGAATEILDSTNQLLSFVNNLISEAQIDTGRLVLKPIKFEPADLLETVQAMVKFTANKKGLAVQAAVDPALPGQIIADPYWLKQILLNLVNNAIKYTDQGSIAVRFQRIGEAHWAVQVKDTGIGIPKEAQQIIFEPFRQIINGSRRQTGSGLGLFIVRHLTTLMNGELALESEVGRGSTFTVTLPLITASD